VCLCHTQRYSLLLVCRVITSCVCSNPMWLLCGRGGVIRGRDSHRSLLEGPFLPQRHKSRALDLGARDCCTVRTRVDASSLPRGAYASNLMQGQGIRIEEVYIEEVV
jgi:hypothetical protein